MTNSEVNQLLHRKLLSGRKYDKYFKKSYCKVEDLGIGDTSHGVNAMQEYAFTHAYQSTEIASNEFTGFSLEKTVEKIHHFLYNHIQYKKDGNLQDLRAPYCIWSSRKSGTDCKSYSIFASTILINLNIKHYIRRVIYHGDNVNTHVYVIVPHDQVHGNLSAGYLTIDGTMKENIELPFKKPSDTYMEPELQYRGLSQPTFGLGCSCQDQSIDFYGGRQFQGLGAAYPGQKAIDVSHKTYNDAVLMAMDNFDLFMNQISAPSRQANQLRQKIFNKLFQGNDPELKITRQG
ncbi:hypothetical protein, partial [Kordia sp.]|uniref:hypothetical protein n=1 Tax=Kordia sp. TaxID=1965332 RepID=UPI0025BB25F9